MYAAVLMIRGGENFKEHQQGPLEDSLWFYGRMCVFQYIGVSIECIKYNMTSLIRTSQHVLLFLSVEREDEKKQENEILKVRIQRELKIKCLWYCGIMQVQVSMV